MPFYYSALVKTISGPRGVPTKVPDIPAGVTWAGNWSTAPQPGYPNGTEVYGIVTNVAIPTPWPTGMAEMTRGNWTAWQTRTGEGNQGAVDQWLGG